MKSIIIFLIIFLNVLMSMYILMGFQQKKLNSRQFVFWFVFVYLTGPIGYFLYLYLYEGLKKHSALNK
ncbi:hypothetical protein J6TS2_24110 [Heyndrickxia sporothermodurans]|nr:hypothetical protein J6TS2_24110 [Heyndrickxia sporothermodurans]